MQKCLVQIALALLLTGAVVAQQPPTWASQYRTRHPVEDRQRIQISPVVRNHKSKPNPTLIQNPYIGVQGFELSPTNMTLLSLLTLVLPVTIGCLRRFYLR